MGFAPLVKHLRAPSPVGRTTGTVERELAIVPGYGYTHVGSRKVFNGRTCTCRIAFLLRAPDGRVVWEPFGKYYYALGAVTVAPAVTVAAAGAGNEGE
jgi:hypothetical protein